MSQKQQPTASATDDPPGSPERRKADRYRCCRNCTVRPEAAAGVGTWPGIVYNISVSGIGVALPYPVRPGTSLLLELGDRRTGGPIRARVVRAVPVAFVFFHGCAFDEPLDEDELRRWLGKEAESL